MDEHRAIVRRACLAALAVSAALLLGAVLMLIRRHGSDADWTVLGRVVGHRGALLVDASRVVTQAGVLWVLVLVAAAAALPIWRAVGLRAACVPMVALLVASLAAQVLKAWFGRVRPPLALREVTTSGWAFPSGHATNAAALFVSVSLVMVATLARSRRQRVVLIVAGSLAVLLVGSSRLVLGVHWPSDVLAGWALGTAVASAVTFVGLHPLRSAVPVPSSESRTPTD